MKKTIFLFILICLIWLLPVDILAQEEQKPEEVKIDTEITAEDLGVKKATILPDSSLYGFKNIFRKVRENLVFNPIKKAELQLKHANQKMVEAKQLIEEKGTEKAQEIAARTIKDINNDFNKIIRQSDSFKKEGRDKERVEKFLGKVVDQSLKQQIVLQKLEEKVPEQVFAKIEESRQEHLEKFGQVIMKSMENPEKMRDFLPQVIERQSGSNFKELKAIEILKDLEEKVPEEAKEALRLAQTSLSQKLEQRLVNMPEETRRENFQKYVEFLPGNPIRQFEAIETMKQNFQSPEMIQDMELAKDRAMEKFENQFAEFQGEEARSTFMKPWRNGDPNDLRTMTEMEMRIEPAQEEAGPASQSFQNFQGFFQEAKDNFRDRFGENPEALRNNPVFQRMTSQPDVIDLKLSQDLTKIFSPLEKEPIQGMPPEGSLRTFNFMRDFQNQATQKFIENIQLGPAGRPGTPMFVGPPIPGGLKVLEEIKNQVPLQAQQGINRAMEAQIQTMEKHIEKIDNPEMFERYKQQIEGDKMIKRQVEQFGPPTFFRQIEDKNREMQKMQRFEQRFEQPQQPQQGQPPQRPVIPLPGSPGYYGPSGATHKPEEINPPQIKPEFQSGDFQPNQTQQGLQSEQQSGFQPQPQFQPQSGPQPTSSPQEPAPLQPIFPNLWRNFLAAVSKIFNR